MKYGRKIINLLKQGDRVGFEVGNIFDFISIFTKFSIVLLGMPPKAIDISRFKKCACRAAACQQFQLSTLGQAAAKTRSKLL